MVIETIEFILTQFTDEIIAISGLIGFFFAFLLLAYWLYSRGGRSYFSHQIPESVVKNYLESANSNSAATKSSFGDGNGVPSVVPASNLGKRFQDNKVSAKKFNQKVAEVVSLNDKIIIQQNQIRNLENKLADHKQQDPNASEEELSKVLSERDELRNKLQEYEIIEDDLANLKRLQQENQQLKNSLSALQGGPLTPPLEPTTDESQELESKQEDSDASANSGESVDTSSILESISEAKETTQESNPSDDNKQKSSENLLSEFEKMLG